MIGANDLFMLEHTCGGASNVSCILAGLPALLTTLQADVTTIYTALRAAGFRGEFVAVSCYSTNYADPVVTTAVAAVNQVLANVTQAFGGTVADGFGTFAAATAPYGGDTCGAGLLIHLTTTTCDVHTSPAGAALLASAFRAAEGA